MQTALLLLLSAFSPLVPQTRPAVPPEPPKANALFDTALASFKNLNAARVVVETVSKVGPTRRFRYEIAYIRPSTAVMRVINPLQAGSTASDRTFSVIGDRLIAYDRLANEMLQRKAPSSTGMLGKLEAFLGEQDEPVKAILEPNAMELLLLRFKVLQGWTVLDRDKQWVAIRKVKDKDGIATSIWRFDMKTGLPRSVDLSMVTGSLAWTFTFGTPPKDLNFSPPATAISVDAFTVKPLLPRAITTTARPILLRAIEGFSKLRYATWNAVEGGRTTNVAIAVNAVRERQAEVEWTYDGTTLTAYFRKKGTAFRDLVRFSAIPKALDRIGVDIDPTTWQYVSRKGPVYTLLTADVQVKAVGNAKLDGVECDILEIKGVDVTASLWIRRTDGLTAGSGFVRVDGRGQTLASSDRTVHFTSVGKPMALSAFQLKLPQGVTARPFPKPKSSPKLPGAGG